MPLYRLLVGALAAMLLAGCAGMGARPEPAALSQLGRQTDLLMVGEIHGTRETPAAFADLVETAARRQRIAVGLELPDTAIAEARCNQAAPAPGSVWLRSPRDGRTSLAMRELVCRLRALADRGRITLFGFATGVRPQPGRPPHADEIQSRLARTGGPAMLLIGNFHARRVPHGLVTALEASGLRVVTVTVSAPEGTAFTCDRNRQCEARPIKTGFCDVTATQPTLLVGEPARIPATLPWDGCLALPAITASPAMAAGS